MGFTSGYSPFVGGDLVTWRSKKQNVLSCSSTEAKYRTMAHTTCELMWSKNFMSEIGCPLLLLCLCENQAAIHIATKPVFHESNS